MGFIFKFKSKKFILPETTCHLFFHFEEKEQFTCIKQAFIAINCNENVLTIILIQLNFPESSHVNK